MAGTTVWLEKGIDKITPTSFNVDSLSHITTVFSFPSASAGTWSLVVRNPDFKTASEAFEVKNPAPILINIVPANSLAGNIVSATITGENFGTVTTVWLRKTVSANIVPTGPLVITSIQISCTFAIPAQSLNPAGTWDVVAMNVGGQQAVLCNAFTVTNMPGPAVDSVRPDSGNAGTSVPVTIPGSHFATGATGSLVKTGAADISATSISVTSLTQITCTLPLPAVSPTSGGAWDVVVTNPDGQSGTKTAVFTVLNPTMTLTGVTPDKGYAGTTTKDLTLTGTNFIIGTTPSIWLEKESVKIPAWIVVTITNPTKIHYKFVIPEPDPTVAG